MTKQPLLVRNLITTAAKASSELTASGKSDVAKELDAVTQKMLKLMVGVQMLTETFQECPHERTIDIGDEDHNCEACTDCGKIL